jgi:hypothetical protein
MKSIQSTPIPPVYSKHTTVLTKHPLPYHKEEQWHEQPKWAKVAGTKTWSYNFISSTPPMEIAEIIPGKSVMAMLMQWFTMQIHFPRLPTANGMSQKHFWIVYFSHHTIDVTQNDAVIKPRNLTSYAEFTLGPGKIALELKKQRTCGPLSCTFCKAMPPSSALCQLTPSIIEVAIKDSNCRISSLFNWHTWITLLGTIVSSPFSNCSFTFFLICQCSPFCIQGLSRWVHCILGAHYSLPITSASCALCYTELSDASSISTGI